MAAVEAGEFALIIVGYEGDDRDGAAGRLAQTFSLDVTTARQVLDGAPVVIREGMNKGDVKGLTPVLQDLSGAGLEFRVTARAVDTLPRLHLSPTGNPGFSLANRGFVCPCCGEAFMFSQSSRLKLQGS